MNFTRSTGRVKVSADVAGVVSHAGAALLRETGSTCNFGDNTPLRGGKYTLWEGGIRVPFMVRWPAGGISGGRESTSLVSSMDLYPSLLSAAGGSRELWAGCDGIDQLGTWRGEESGPGHGALHWDTGFQWAVREGEWKLYYGAPGARADQLYQQEHAEMLQGIRLTNLDVDIGEDADLVAKHPQVVSRLLARHEAWRAEVGMPVPVPSAP